MQRKVLEIVETEREIRALREVKEGHEAHLADLMEADKISKFQHQGYIAILSSTRKLKVRSPRPTARRKNRG